jgi:lactose/L-arabinose transport system ATP-binding protein
MAAVTLKGVSKQFGTTTVVDHVDLDIADGEFVVFVGPSGCGKSTLLRMVAGLESSSAGEIRIGSRNVTELPASDRGCAMVFQAYALYPHMTVKQNLTFGMRMRGVDRALIASKLATAVEMLQLAPYLDRKPAQLSGGQAQRVAIGRALAQDSDVFLLDEPLSNLDAELRLRMRVEIAALHKRLGKTMIYVTHDQVEAMTLADRIVVLRSGAIEQVGSPMTLYANPANAFVAGFIGSPAMNMLSAVQIDDHCVRLPDSTELSVEIKQSSGGVLRQNVTVGIRPEHLRITSEKSGAFSMQVIATEALGATTYVYGQCAGAEVCVETRGAFAPPNDGLVHVTPVANAAYVFDVDGRTVSAEKRLVELQAV